MLTLKSNTFFLLAVLFLLSILSFYIEIKGYYFVLVFFFWLLIAVAGSGLIRMNYHLKAHSRSFSSDRKIAITFDDGPTEITPEVLDVLKKNSVKATFFCIGNQIEKHPEIFDRIIAEGHLIGNHSFTHSKNIGFFSKEKMLEEISQTDISIAKFLGKKPRYYRPPFGVTNPNIAKALKDTKHYVIGWNVRSLDTKIKTEEKILKRIKSRISPGSIILLHDTSLKSLRVLEQLLVFLQENNYEAVTVEQLLKIPTYEN